MRARDLARFRAQTAEGSNVFTLAVVLIDVAGPIAIADIQIAIGRDSQVGGAVFDRLAIGAWLVLFRFLGIPDAKNFFARQCGLHYYGSLRIAKIKKLLLPFLEDVH